ncbi:MAG: PrsW family glutamic-type intramembrane protease [Dehalococcoidia bacterium]|nr:PrsW family glutamic-type intramembrane protease [Dehalococcoidia bacterium]
MQSKLVLKRFEFVRHTWFLVLAVGLAIFVAMDAAFIITLNPRLLPTVLLLGASLIPATFVIYVYQRVQAREVPLSALATVAFLGGALGLLVAGLLEYATLRQLGIFRLLGVGLIEESAKLIFPLVVYFRGHYRSEADGLLFGVASGMSFSAMESMGYGLAAFLQNNGGIGALEETLLLRGLLAPIGHAAWTGLVCAVIWRERQRAGHMTLNLAVAAAFLTAVLLHTSWDTLGSLTSRLSITWVGFDFAGLAVVGTLSLALLIWRMRKAGVRHPLHAHGG